jgi:hypothetical protein
MSWGLEIFTCTRSGSFFYALLSYKITLELIRDQIVKVSIRNTHATISHTIII